MWAAHAITTRPRPPVRNLSGMPENDLAENTAALLRGAAVEIARMPGLAARLRALHVPGPDGRCRGCTSEVHPSPRWPCRIAFVAGRASEPRAAGPVC